MNTRAPRSERGLPVTTLVVVLGTVGMLGLIAIGAWSLSGNIKLETIPVTGEWQAEGKPWRLEFRADKTVVSSTGTSQQALASLDLGTRNLQGGLFRHPLGHPERRQDLFGVIGAPARDFGANDNQPV